MFALLPHAYKLPLRQRKIYVRWQILINLLKNYRWLSLQKTLISRLWSYFETERCIYIYIFFSKSWIKNIHGPGGIILLLLPHRPRVVWPCALVRGVDVPLRPAPVIFVRLLVWFEWIGAVAFQRDKHHVARARGLDPGRLEQRMDN
jgi:hypothetical protein